MKNKGLLFSVCGALIIFIFIGLGFFYKKSMQKELAFIMSENSKVFVPDHAPRYGDESAKVYLIEFLDPECESCREFYPMVKSLLKEFEGKVQLVVRYAPFHANSTKAIKALEATRKQGKYWEALEMLFHYQPYWGDHHNPRPELVLGYLEKLGLDMDKLQKDMASPEIDKIIQQDLNDLRKLNVRGTPTFFVNGREPERFGIEFLRKLLKDEVGKQYP